MSDLFDSAYNNILNGNAFNLKEMLDHLIENYESYEPTWHALGFIHCFLAKNETGTLRLHIWKRNERHVFEQIEKIHDHLFSLKSYVLLGAIYNEVFDLEETYNDSFEFESYTVKYLENGSQLKSTGKFYNIKKSTENKVKEGGFYTVSSDEFHRSSVIDHEYAVTLVATYGHLDKEPTTLISQGQDIKLERAKVYYQKDLWRDLLICFRNDL